MNTLLKRIRAKFSDPLKGSAIRGSVIFESDRYDWGYTKAQFQSDINNSKSVLVFKIFKKKEMLISFNFDIKDTAFDNCDLSYPNSLENYTKFFLSKSAELFIGYYSDKREFGQLIDFQKLLKFLKGREQLFSLNRFIKEIELLKEKEDEAYFGKFSVLYWESAISYYSKILSLPIYLIRDLAKAIEKVNAPNSEKSIYYSSANINMLEEIFNSNHYPPILEIVSRNTLKEIVSNVVNFISSEKLMTCESDYIGSAADMNFINKVIYGIPQYCVKFKELSELYPEDYKNDFLYGMLTEKEKFFTLSADFPRSLTYRDFLNVIRSLSKIKSKDSFKTEILGAYFANSFDFTEDEEELFVSHYKSFYSTINYNLEDIPRVFSTYYSSPSQIIFCLVSLLFLNFPKEKAFYYMAELQLIEADVTLGKLLETVRKDFEDPENEKLPLSWKYQLEN